MNKKTIVCIIIANVVLGLIIYSFWIHEKNIQKQIACLKPIAEEPCNSLNLTLGASVFRGDFGAIYVPQEFPCVKEGPERQIGYTHQSEYKFLKDELEGCKK